MSNYMPAHDMPESTLFSTFGQRDLHPIGSCHNEFPPGLSKHASKGLAKSPTDPTPKHLLAPLIDIAPSKKACPRAPPIDCESSTAKVMGVPVLPSPVIHAGLC